MVKLQSVDLQPENAGLEKATQKYFPKWWIWMLMNLMGAQSVKDHLKN